MGMGIMIEMETTNQTKFFVSEKTFKWASKLRWMADKRPKCTYIYTSLFSKKVYLHKLIYAFDGNGLCVDHINRDTLNNCLENLRLTTASGNSTNSIKTRKVAQYRGIYKTKDRWITSLTSKGKTYRIFSNKSAEEAARKYDLLAKEHHGAAAILNFPEES